MVRYIVVPKIGFFKKGLAVNPIFFYGS